MAPAITTADGQAVAIGDRVFSHYTMTALTLTDGPDAQGWARWVADDGQREFLDGSRVCSLAHAKRMGWLA